MYYSYYLVCFLICKNISYGACVLNIEYIYWWVIVCTSDWSCAFVCFSRKESNLMQKNLNNEHSCQVWLCLFVGGVNISRRLLHRESWSMSCTLSHRYDSNYGSVVVLLFLQVSTVCLCLTRYRLHVRGRAIISMGFINLKWMWFVTNDISRGYNSIVVIVRGPTQE